MENKLAHRRRRASIARAACVLVLAAAGAGTFAAADESSFENVVVTGSRIGRADFDSPSPLVTIPEFAFEQTGAVSVERTLDLYPQFVAAAGATSNEPSNDGQANVSLRGLGPSRTLVLLDGRRIMPADAFGAVDLNILPPALVESVQVVTGGASAVYGSDAIAGVVNFRLRERFDGLQFGGSGSVTGHGDGEEYTADVTAGTSFAEGRGRVYGYVGYSERDAILQDQRSFSRYPLEYVPGLTGGRGPHGAFIASGSGTGDEAANIVFSNRGLFERLFASYGYAPGAVPYQAGLGVNADGTIFTIGNGTPGSVANYRGERDPVMFNDRAFNVYNFAPDTALLMPLERHSAFARAAYDASDAVELYAQVLYADYSVTRQLAPAAVGILLVPPTNPFVPPDLKLLLDSRVAPSAPYRYFRRASDVGPRTAVNERDVVQLTLGSRGMLAANWRFDVYAQYGENDRNEQQTNNVSLSRLQDLSFAADGGTSICEGGFDPFLPRSLSSECAKYVAVTAANAVTLRQLIAEISVTGPVMTLPSGNMDAALGLFYSEEDFDYDADEALSAVLPPVPGVIGARPDIAGFAASPDRSGDDSNVDAYVELRAPLLRDRPAVQFLEAGVGYRYSSYEEAGAVSSYKADLLYRPVQPLLLRGSYQHAVRAPSIEELYFPPVANQFVIPIPDPCDTDSAARRGPDRAQVEALCLAQGLPASLLPVYDFELRRVDGVAGGNPDLEPEQADTWTLGFVYSQSFERAGVNDLQVSVDAYDIEIEDGIGRWDLESAVARCFDPHYNPTFAVGNVYCNFFTRDSINGNIVGQVIDRNIGGLETSGVDVQLDWGLDAGPGTLGINALVTYVDEWTYLDPSGGTIEYAGTVGGSGLGRSLPRWKSLVQLDYDWGAAGLMVRWQHVDEMQDVEFREFDVPARDYLSVGVSYDVEAGDLRGLALRAGVENLTNQSPPVFPSWQQANTDPSQYDVLGRRYYARVTYRTL
jgi:outer membrane receptor protein involved in Fe transport